MRILPYVVLLSLFSGNASALEKVSGLIGYGCPVKIGEHYLEPLKVSLPVDGMSVEVALYERRIGREVFINIPRVTPKTKAGAGWHAPSGTVSLCRTVDACLSSAGQIRFDALRTGKGASGLLRLSGRETVAFSAEWLSSEMAIHRMCNTMVNNVTFEPSKAN